MENSTFNKVEMPKLVNCISLPVFVWCFFYFRFSRELFRSSQSKAAFFVRHKFFYLKIMRCSKKGLFILALFIIQYLHCFACAVRVEPTFFFLIQKKFTYQHASRIYNTLSRETDTIHTNWKNAPYKRTYIRIIIIIVVSLFIFNYRVFSLFSNQLSSIYSQLRAADAAADAAALLGVNAILQ